MKAKKLLLRRAMVEDCDDIYRWRNDEVTRRNSFNSGLIPYEEHCQWFRKVLDNPQMLLFIGIEEDNGKCGIVRFDVKNDFASEVHINLSPQKRGEGIGTKMLEDSCNLFFTETGSRLVFARIKEVNIVSVKAFLKAGFFEVFHYLDRESSGGGVIVLAQINPCGGLHDEDPLHGQQSGGLKYP